MHGSDLLATGIYLYVRPCCRIGVRRPVFGDLMENPDITEPYAQAPGRSERSTGRAIHRGGVVRRVDEGPADVGAPGARGGGAGSCTAQCNRFGDGRVIGVKEDITPPWPASSLLPGGSK